MPFQPYKLDDSFTRTEPGRPRLPQGFYLSEITGLVPTPRDYDKTAGYTVAFRILEGPQDSPGAGVGRTIDRYHSMGGKEGSQFNMARTLGAAGQGDVARALRDDPKWSDIQTWEMHAQMGRFIEQKIKGVRVVLTIVDEMSPQGRPFSSVMEVQAAADWGTLKQTPLVGGAQPSPNGADRAPNQTLAEQVQGMFEKADIG